MKGELYFNKVDAYTKYGVSMLSGTLTALLTPPAAKGMVTNQSRLEDGTRYTVPDGIRLAERDVTLNFSIKGKDENEFAARYAAFIALLTAGTLTVSTSYESGKYYRLLYQQCTTFGQVGMTYAKISVKFKEPNPNNRA